jgi:pimeloyl-ACP methyl ester carboxylesterase
MSDKPSKGYDLQTRANDIAEFLSAMRMPAASLIGHSMAGDEMVKIAVDHPERVAKLVFLDAAAIDRTNMVSTMLDDPLLPPVWKKMASEVLGKNEKIDVPAGQLPPPDLYGRWIEILKTSSVGVDQARKVKAPALVYFAIPDQHPAISPKMPDDQKNAADRYFATKMKPMMRHQIELVRSGLKNAEFITIEPGDHYFFQRRGRETAEEILKFLRD